MGPEDPHQQHPDRWSFLNVSHLIEREGIEPTREALVLDGISHTYGGLRESSYRVSNSLLKQGLNPDDRVAISARNCLEYFELEFGTAGAGCIFIPLSWRLSTDERLRLLQRSQARTLIADPDFAEPLMRARGNGDLPDLEQIVTLDDGSIGDTGYAEWIADSPPLKPDVVRPPMTAAHEVIYTSGTTGDPKGVIWTHGTVLWNATQQIVDFGLRPGDSTYVNLDLNYIGGRHDLTLALLQQGGTVHLRRSGGFDAAATLHYLAEHRITHVLWVPTMLHDVLGQAELIDGLDLSSLRMIMCGGAPLSREMILQAQSLFPQADFVQVFGLTEGGGTPTFVPQHRLLDKVGSAGLPSMFNEIKIVGEDGAERATNEVGEILVRGPAVTPGYWDNAAGSAVLVEDGWLHTGDLGRRDEEGFLYVAGRARDLIITGGMNVFPADVEHVIAELPDVDLVAVVGVPDERWGERVCAVIRRVPGSQLTAQAVTEHCRNRLAGYKKPTRIAFTEDFPMTISGKIRKNTIAEHIVSGGIEVQAP